jgi:hypothetical protein
VHFRAQILKCRQWYSENGRKAIAIYLIVDNGWRKLAPEFTGVHVREMLME